MLIIELVLISGENNQIGDILLLLSTYKDSLIQRTEMDGVEGMQGSRELTKYNTRKVYSIRDCFFVLFSLLIENKSSTISRGCFRAKKLKETTEYFWNNFNRFYSVLVEMNGIQIMTFLSAILSWSTQYLPEAEHQESSVCTY